MRRPAHEQPIAVRYFQPERRRLRRPGRARGRHVPLSNIHLRGADVERANRPTESLQGQFAGRLGADRLLDCGKDPAGSSRDHERLSHQPWPVSGQVSRGANRGSRHEEWRFRVWMRIKLLPNDTRAIGGICRPGVSRSSATDTRWASAKTQIQGCAHFLTVRAAASWEYFQGTRGLAHDPEKCAAVFGQDHAQTKS